MKRILVIAAIASAALFSGGAALAQSPIRIGLSGAFTGPAALASEWEKWGVDLAVEEFNAAGLIPASLLRWQLTGNAPDVLTMLSAP